MDVDDVFVAVNGSYASLFGSSQENLLGSRLQDIGTESENPAFYEALAQTRADGQQRRIRNRSLDSGRVFDNILTPADDLIVIEVADVTEEVREHDRRRRVETARDVIWQRVAEFFVIVDIQDRQILASPAVWERWPIQQLEDALLDGSLLQVDKDAPQWSDLWPSPAALFDGRVERSISEVFLSVTEQRHRSVVPLEGQGPRYFDTQLVPWVVDGTCRGVVIIAQDQTDLMRRRDQQTLAEEATAHLLANLPASVWEVDIDDRTIRPLFADRRQPAHPTWGEPVTITSFLAMWDPDSQIRLRALLSEGGVDTASSLRIVSADHERTAHINVSAAPPSEVNPHRRLLAVVTDMTIEFAEEMADSRRDHATQVMRFAQGVAHDFGNVAQVVGGYADLLQQTHDDHVVDMASRHLASASRRAVAVARRIALIARVERVMNAPLDIGTTVVELCSELKAAMPPTIDMSVTAEPDLWGIGERSQIASALENLCGNAARAMNDGGRIAIRVLPLMRHGRHFVEVEVADNGPGIPTDLLATVFDPFVTGNPGSGTGLGLYLLQEYMHSIRGDVSVISSPAGATFHLQFPAVPVRLDGQEQRNQG